VVEEHHIREALHEVTGHVIDVGSGDDLYAAGIDSLDHASLLITLEDKHTMKFPEDVVEKLNTIQDILTWMRGL
jgi:acyl carrier protein